MLALQKCASLFITYHIRPNIFPHTHILKKLAKTDCKSFFKHFDIFPHTDMFPYHVKHSSTLLLKNICCVVWQYLKYLYLSMSRKVTLDWRNYFMIALPPKTSKHSLDLVYSTDQLLHKRRKCRIWLFTPHENRQAWFI